MNCRYCFYKKELNRAGLTNQGVMSETALEILTDRIAESRAKRVHLAFQGGEPTLAGIEYYYEMMHQLKTKTADKKMQIDYCIQTNGLLIDEKWAELFKKYNFLVGLSYDGTEFLHDSFRRDNSGKGTAERVVRAWKLLKQYEINTNILCVVTGKLARKPEQVYKSLKSTGARYLQFIPCITEDGCLKNEEFKLDTQTYAFFLKGIFDLWYQDWKKGDYVSIRQFEDYIHLGCGDGTSSCAACGRCGSYLVTEASGNLYPCDFYVNRKYEIGNIRDYSFEEALTSERAVNFVNTVYRSSECSRCRWYVYCRGGCKNDYRTGENGMTNIYCNAYRDFFEYASSRLEEITECEKRYAAYQY